MVVCGTHEGLYRLDGPFAEPTIVATCGRVRAVVHSGDARIAATDDGLLRSTDGRNWVDVGLSTQPTSVLAAPETFVVGTRPVDVRRASSDPSGDGWQFESVGDLSAHPHNERWRDRAPGSGPSVRTLTMHPDDGILAGLEPGGVYAFDGDFWRRYGRGVHDDVHDLRVLPGGGVVAATGNGLYRTDDGGTWYRVDTDFRDFWANYFRETIYHENRLYTSANRWGPERPSGVIFSAVTEGGGLDGRPLENAPVPTDHPAFVISWTTTDGTVVGGTMRVGDGFEQTAPSPLVVRDGDGWTVGATLPAGITSLST